MASLRYSQRLCLSIALLWIVSLSLTLALLCPAGHAFRSFSKPQSSRRLLRPLNVDVKAVKSAQLSKAAKVSLLGSSSDDVEGSGGFDISSNGGVHSIAFTVAGKRMKFETGKIGRQASGSVVASTEESTMVYSTVCHERDTTPVDFTPLRVDYFARYSAVGQTIGAFHRRDSRGDDTEILVARLIDRPIRPMIAEGWQHETQILAWLLSYDKQHSAEPLAICAASAAAAISAVPLVRPVAGVELGMIDGEVIVNPTKEQVANSTLHLTLAGTKTGILMIEGVADFLPESELIRALQIGHAAIGRICEAIEEFQRVAGVPKKVDTLRKLPSELVDDIDELFGPALTAALSIGDKHQRGAAIGGVEKEIIARFVLDEAPKQQQLSVANKELSDETDPDAPLVDMTEEDAVGIYESDTVATDSTSAVAKASSKEVLEEDEASELSSAAIASAAAAAASSFVASTPERVVVPSAAAATVSFDKASASSSSVGAAKTSAGYNYDAIDVKVATKKLLVRRLREMVLYTSTRSDGRGQEDVRPIEIETSLLPGAHGSSLFTRGETQSISTATLGSKAMEAKFETVDQLGTKRFYLQYRFPPSSVGEVGRVGGVNRREVGHGNLAERALAPCLPEPADFPYSIRTESLITESCGSSSMATVCGCCLAMLDAGVPLTTSVAGVAMGLILGEKEGDEPVVLTDILGLEDALGTMDFKIAGNETGVTTFQLDIKSEGLTLDILGDALEQAKRGRLVILDKMRAALSSPRALKSTIPRILGVKIPPELVGKVIGPKGKTLHGLIETYGLTNINCEDDGSIQVESFSEESNLAAKEAILAIAVESEDGGGRRRGGGGGGAGAEKKELGEPPEEGKIYRDCEITGIQTFGIFVEICNGHEGLVHISELDTKKVSAPLENAGFAMGQKLDIKVLGKNDKGKLRLSRRAVMLRDAGAESGSTGASTANTTTASTVTAPVLSSKAAEDAYS